MKKKETKKSLKGKPFVDLPESPSEEMSGTAPIMDAQTLNQRKIALAQSVHSSIIVELVKDVLQQVPLVGNDQWETIRNSIIIDTSSTLLRDLVEHLEDIKKGKLIGQK